MTKVVKPRDALSLCANLREHVKTGATICTDALMSFDDPANDYQREIIGQMERYAKGQVDTNGLVDFWSLLKRGLKERT